MVNFGEVWRSQLAKFTLLASTMVPLGSFKVCTDARESGVQKAMGSCCTYSSLVKLQPRFLSLQWKTCLWAKLQPWCLSLQLQKTDDYDNAIHFISISIGSEITGLASSSETNNGWKIIVLTIHYPYICLMVIHFFVKLNI